MLLPAAIVKDEFPVPVEGRGIQAVLAAQEEEGAPDVEVGNVHMPVFVRLNGLELRSVAADTTHPTITKTTTNEKRTLKDR